MGVGVSVFACQKYSEIRPQSLCNVTKIRNATDLAQNINCFQNKFLYLYHILVLSLVIFYFCDCSYLFQVFLDIFLIFLL